VVEKYFYNPAKTDGLSNNTIMDLIANFNNKLWTGTGNDICYYDYYTKKIKQH
jgi:ligand-binding sensor domain-containing protein